MTNSNNDGQKRDLDDVIEDAPDSKHGTEGQAAHGGDQAGPNSAESGKPQSPQTGNPRSPDRRPN